MGNNSIKFGTGGASGSSYGKQFNDKFWSNVAIREAKRKKVFSQKGDSLTQPKHFGDKIVKYHELPIIHELNINDQGVDANGAQLVKNKWFAYNKQGVMVGDPEGYFTQEEAYDHIRKWSAWDSYGGRLDNNGQTSTDWTAATEALAVNAHASIKIARPIIEGKILSGNGNLYGGDTDYAIVDGSFPPLDEEGGVMNAVGMKRLDIEAKVEEFGFHVPFTKKALEMDTERGLLARISREVGVAQSTIREMQIQKGLLSASESNRVFAGNASNIAEVGAGDELTFASIRGMQQSLKAARSPKQTTLITGTDKVGTVVVGAGYTAYCGQEMLPTLEDMEHGGASAWKPVEAYAAAGKIADGEIGTISATRFIEVEDMMSYKGQGAHTKDSIDDVESTNRHSSRDHYDVFPILYVGDDSFATVGFEGDVARVTTIMPKPDAHNDVYGKKGAVAISWYFGMMIYRPERIRQVLCSAKLN